MNATPTLFPLPHFSEVKLLDLDTDLKMPIEKELKYRNNDF